MLGLSGKIFMMMAAGAMAYASLVGTASAQTEDEIARALAPPPPPAPVTRGLTPITPPKAAPAPNSDFVDSLRNKNSGALTRRDREELGNATKDLKSIDLTMEFDFNSDVLRGEALATAHRLGGVMSRPDYKGQTYMIAGHTDGKGNDSVNQRLSERRADAVRRFLVSNYSIPAANLITVGYGRTKLKNSGDPLAAENRRVQAANMLQSKTAGR